MLVVGCEYCVQLYWVQVYTTGPVITRSCLLLNPPTNAGPYWTGGFLPLIGGWMNTTYRSLLIPISKILRHFYHLCDNKFLPFKIQSRLKTIFLASYHSFIVFIWDCPYNFIVEEGITRGVGGKTSIANVIIFWVETDTYRQY